MNSILFRSMGKVGSYKVKVKPVVGGDGSAMAVIVQPTVMVTPSKTTSTVVPNEV